MLDTVQYIFLENCRGIQCFNLGGISQDEPLTEFH